MSVSIVEHSDAGAVADPMEVDGYSDESGEEESEESEEPVCKRTLFPSPGDQVQRAEPLPQLTPEREKESITDLRRQLRTLLESNTMLSAKVRSCEIEIADLKARAEEAPTVALEGDMAEKVLQQQHVLNRLRENANFGCATAMNLMPHLNDCVAFQTGCGTEMPVVELLENTTVAMACRGGDPKNFEMSLTFKTRERSDGDGDESYESEEEDWLSDEDEDEVGPSSEKKLFRKRRKERRDRRRRKRAKQHPQWMYLRVRYGLGRDVTLTEASLPGPMRYVYMEGDWSEFRKPVADFAEAAGLPVKALKIIIAMGVHLLPPACSEAFRGWFGHAYHTTFNHVGAVAAGREPKE